MEYLNGKRFLIYTMPRDLTHGFDTAGRGEERWGLNIARCLVEHGYDVYARIGTRWLSPDPQPMNFRVDVWPQGPDVVSFAYYSANLNGVISGDEMCIACVFDVPKFPYPISNKWAIVHSYPAGTRFNALSIRGGNGGFLPHVMSIPDDNVNRFHNTNIFWTGKAMFSPGSQPHDVPEALMQWAGTILKTNPQMTFSTISFWPNIEDDVQAIARTRSHHLFGHFNGVMDRVTIHGTLDYSSMKQEIARSKIILNAGNFWHTYGGSPIEAAFYGIPSIQFDENPFIECSEKIVLPVKGFSSRYSEMLNKLHTDQVFYQQKAQAYKSYARSVYSPSNFLNLLNNIVAQCSG